MNDRTFANPDLAPNLALAASVWLVMAVTFASLAPSALVPHLFNSFHVEHFAAFYVLAAAASLGLPRRGLTTLAPAVIGFACLLEALRMLTPAHRLTSAADLVCDVDGVVAAFAPILFCRFRQRMARLQRQA